MNDGFADRSLTTWVTGDVFIYITTNTIQHLKKL